MGLLHDTKVLRGELIRDRHTVVTNFLSVWICFSESSSRIKTILSDFFCIKARQVTSTQPIFISCLECRRVAFLPPGCFHRLRMSWLGSCPGLSVGMSGWVMRIWWWRKSSPRDTVTRPSRLSSSEFPNQCWKLTNSSASNSLSRSPEMFENMKPLAVLPWIDTDSPTLVFK